STRNNGTSRCVAYTRPNNNARPRPSPHPLRCDPARRRPAPHRLGEDRPREVAGRHRLSPRQLLLLLPADDVDSALDRHFAAPLVVPPLTTASSRGPTTSRSGRGSSGPAPTTQTRNQKPERPPHTGPSEFWFLVSGLAARGRRARRRRRPR